MSYNPDTGLFHVPGTVRTAAFVRYGDKFKKGLQYNGGSRTAPIGSPMSSAWTAIGGTNNKIAWQKDCAVPRRHRRRIDHHGERPVVAWRPWRDNRGARCKVRRTALAVPDRFWREGNANDLRGQRRRVHRHRSPAAIRETTAQTAMLCGASVEGAGEPVVALPPPPTVAGPASGPIADDASTIKSVTPMSSLVTSRSETVSRQGRL